MQPPTAPTVPATAASTGADLNGKAAQDAARQIRARLAAYAVKLYGGAADAVRFASDTVFVNGHAVPFPQLVQQAYLARTQLWSDGYYATPGLSWDPKTMNGRPFSYFAYGAAVAEVVVDTLTGEWKLLRADALYDAGRSSFSGPITSRAWRNSHPTRAANAPSTPSAPARRTGLHGR